MSTYWHAPQNPWGPYVQGQPPYGHQPFQGAPNWQGGQPPWLAALLAAHQAAQPQAPQLPVIPNASALPPGLVGNTHVPFLQPGGGGYPGNYQGFGGGHGGGQDFGHPMPPTGIPPTGIFPIQQPPTVGRVGV